MKETLSSGVSSVKTFDSLAIDLTVPFTTSAEAAPFKTVTRTAVIRALNTPALKFISFPSEFVNYTTGMNKNKAGARLQTIVATTDGQMEYFTIL
jgi:hypothetical protein